MSPPAPPEADPDLMVIEPLDPAFAAPVDTEILPLSPAEPPAPVLMTTFPLDVDDPTPEVTCKSPPREDEDTPPAMLTAPPTPLLPDPTEIEMPPPDPPTLAPLTTDSAPEESVDVEPENMDTDPLTPLTPAAELDTLTFPLDVAVAAPDVTDTDPPALEPPLPLLSDA